MERNNKSVEDTLRYNYLLAIPIIAGLGILSPDIVSWYMGNDFLPCIEYLRMMAPIILFMITNNILRVQILIAQNRDKEYIYSIVVSMMFNLMVNLLLVKEYGIYGVIWGSILAEAWATMYLVKHTKNSVKYKNILTDILQYVIATFGMSCGLIMMPDNDRSIVSMIGKIVIGVLLYVTVYICLKCLLKRVKDR